MLPFFSLQLKGESGSGVSAWRARRTPSSLFLPLLPVPGCLTSVLLAVAWFFVWCFVDFVCVSLCVGEGVLSHPVQEKSKDTEGLKLEN